MLYVASGQPGGLLFVLTAECCAWTRAQATSGAKAFQRVKAEEWLDKKGAINNHYEATFGQAGWGYKAQQVLGQVRGK